MTDSDSDAEIEVSAFARLAMQSKMVRKPINFLMSPVPKNAAFSLAVHKVDPVALVFQRIEQPEGFVL